MIGKCPLWTYLLMMAFTLVKKRGLYQRHVCKQSFLFVFPYVWGSCNGIFYLIHDLKTICLSFLQTLARIADLIIQFLPFLPFLFYMS